MNALWFAATALFPPKCLPCGRLLYAGAICNDCFRPALLSVYRSPQIGAGFFWRTAIPRTPIFPYLSGAAAGYGPHAVKALVRGLKFGGIKDAAEPLADLIASYILPFRKRLDGYIVLPIPLARERLKNRGYNQAALIARSAADRLALPYSGNIIFRTTNTAPQTGTSGWLERSKNISGCFSVARDKASRGRFIVIDDVTTTGATLLEAARTLARAGAERIITIAAAKA